MRYDYMWVLQGKYQNRWEDLTEVNKHQRGALKEIRADLRAYRENEGGEFRIIERRVEKKQPDLLTVIADIDLTRSEHAAVL